MTVKIDLFHLEMSTLNFSMICDDILEKYESILTIIRDNQIVKIIGSQFILFEFLYDVTC